MKEKMGELKKEKVFYLVGLGIGAIMIIVGFCLLVGGVDGHNVQGYIESYSFGADFYTEQYNATRLAAVNAAAIAYYVEDVINVLNKCFGWMFIFSGALVCLANVKHIIFRAVNEENQNSPEGKEPEKVEQIGEQIGEQTGEQLGE